MPMPGNRNDREPDDDSGMATEMTAAERGMMVESLVEDMGELFHGYAAGEVAFEELTFEMFDTLQTLHAIITGNFTIEYEDEYDEFDELAGEPTGEGNSQPSASRRKDKGAPPTPPGHKPKGRR